MEVPRPNNRYEEQNSVPEAECPLRLRAFALFFRLRFSGAAGYASTFSSTIRPSKSEMLRSAYSAYLGSCVTMQIVAPP